MAGVFNSAFKRKINTIGRFQMHSSSFIGKALHETGEIKN